MIELINFLGDIRWNEQNKYNNINNFLCFKMKGDNNKKKYSNYIYIEREYKKILYYQYNLTSRNI